MTEREIIIGTSGFTFDDWKGVFYPEKIAQRHWLPYYAQFFSAVEINSSYYAVPRPGALARMAQITPPDFRFSVKVPGEITHKRDNSLAPFEQFSERLAELTETDRAEALLAQFPFGFRRSEAAEEYLAFARENLPNIPLFVEFRHSSWDNPESVELIRGLDIGWVSPDEPAMPQLMSRKVISSGEAAYIRLHGRDASKWWSDGGKLRYDYNYNKTELGEIISRIHGLPDAVTRVFVFFNNCHGGSAVRNALAMKELLGQSTFPQGGRMGLI